MWHRAPSGALGGDEDESDGDVSREILAAGPTLGPPVRLFPHAYAAAGDALATGAADTGTTTAPLGAAETWTSAVATTTVATATATATAIFDALVRGYEVRQSQSRQSSRSFGMG